MSPQSPYAARPWTRRWDYWVRSNLSYPGRSLYDVLALSAIERPERPATQFLGAQLTYLDLKRRADALAASLARMGITKGDRVGIMLPNCPQYIIASFAILRLGAIVVNINPSYTPREALIITTDSGVRTVITLDALAPLIQGIQSQTAITSIVITSLAEYSAAAAPPPRIDGTATLADLLAPAAAADIPRVRSSPRTSPSCSTPAG
jgi:long-chain acyl-CoA synthetase